MLIIVQSNTLCTCYSAAVLLHLCPHCNFKPGVLVFDSSKVSIHLSHLACEATKQRPYVALSAGRGRGQGAVGRRHNKAAYPWGGGVSVWGSPLPGLLWHESLQQGQLVHGAELYGKDVYAACSKRMTAVMHMPGPQICAIVHVHAVHCVHGASCAHDKHYWLHCMNATAWQQL